MITIIISGPQAVGKSAIAQMIYKALTSAGFINVCVYTTNEMLLVPSGSHLEDKP